MIENQEKIKSLLLFIEKVEKLKGYTLLQTLQHGKSGATIKWKKGEGGSSERFGPNEESIDASLLILRFFIQDKDKCSIRRISKFYDELPDTKEIKAFFLNSRNNLNNFLDSPSYFNFSGERLIRRKIFDVFINGGLSHADDDKKKSYDKWMNHPIIKDLITNEFVYIISNLIRFVLHFKKLNEKLIITLQKGS